MTESLEKRRTAELQDFASDVESARHDQVLIISNSGEIVDRKTSARQLNWFVIPVAAGVGVVGSILGLGFLPILLTGVAVTAGPLAYLGWRWRPLRISWRQVVDGDLDGARETLEALARRPPPRGRPIVEQELGRVAILQGRTEAAAEHYARAASELRARRNWHKRPFYWLARCGYASALAILGKVDAAREVRAELDEAPPTRLFDINRQYLDLRVAFAGDDASWLSEVELYDWAKSVLATNLFGTNLALLAWAIDRSGDREMAEHLLGETPERLAGHFLRSSDPALCAFIERSWSDWGLEGELEIP